MTRSTLALTATALVSAAILTAGATGAPSSARRSSSAQQTNTKFLDNPPRGESPGDTISFTDTLRQHGHTAGFAEVTATLVDRKRDADELQGTFHLSGGEIMVQGSSLARV